METRFIALAGSLLTESVSGSAYEYGVYAPQVKTLLNFTQAEISAITTTGNVGQYLALPPGIVFDVLGAQWAIAGGAALSVLGYGLFYAGVAGRVPNSPGMLAFYAFIWNQGSTWFDLASLAQGIKNFPNNKGLVMGLVKSLFGLSASLLTLIYSIWFRPDVVRFLQMLVWLIGVFGLVGGLFNRPAPAAEVAKPLTRGDTTKIYIGYGGVLALSLYLAIVSALQSKGTIQATPGYGLAVIPLLLLQTVQLMPGAWFMPRRRAQRGGGGGGGGGGGAGRRRRAAGAGCSSRFTFCCCCSDTLASDASGTGKGSSGGGSGGLLDDASAASRGLLSSGGADDDDDVLGGGGSGGNAGGVDHDGADSEAGSIAFDVGDDQEGHHHQHQHHHHQRGAAAAVGGRGGVADASALLSMRGRPLLVENADGGVVPIAAGGGSGGRPGDRASAQTVPGDGLESMYLGGAGDRHSARTPPLGPASASGSPGFLSPGALTTMMLVGGQHDDGTGGRYAPHSTARASRTASARKRADELHAVIDAAGKQRPQGATFIEGLFSFDFLLVAIIYFAGTGSGITTINNLGNICQSLGGGADNQDIYVSLLSVFNCCGRMFFGVASDLTAKWISRPAWLTICVGLMCVTMAISTATNLSILYVTSVLAGFSYGGFWSLGPTLMMERWGSRAFASINALSSVSVALGSYALSASMATTIYQANIQGGGTVCLGVACYRGTFIALAAVCAVGTAAAVLLTIKLRPLYVGGQGKAIAYDAFIASYGHAGCTRAIQRALLRCCCCAAGRSLVMTQDEDDDAEQEAMLRRHDGDSDGGFGGVRRRLDMSLPYVTDGTSPAVTGSINGGHGGSTVVGGGSSLSAGVLADGHSAAVPMATTAAVASGARASARGSLTGSMASHSLLPAPARGTASRATSAQSGVVGTAADGAVVVGPISSGSGAPGSLGVSASYKELMMTELFTSAAAQSVAARASAHQPALRVVRSDVTHHSDTDSLLSTDIDASRL